MVAPAVDFDVASTVTHPATLVVETMIERMEVIAPFLRNVDRIELVERTPLADGRLRIVRRWQGSTGALPRALRPFLDDALLAWIDTAVWTPAAGLAEWTNASCAGGVARLYECTGTSRFEPDPADPARRTQMRVAGRLVFHPDRLPGVPTFLGRQIAPQVEAFVVGVLTPNLTGLADGLQRYYDERRG
jgi:hypothetical protein